MLDGKNLVKKSAQNNGTKPRPVPLGNWMRSKRSTHGCALIRLVVPEEKEK
jgi:hypothetical protein